MAEMPQASPSPQLPSTVYLSIAGPVDQAMTQRMFNACAIAVNGGVKHIHAVFHSLGGSVADGVALYNFFRALPIDLHFYNLGMVASIGTIAFLGAKHRYASAHATFMVHKSHFNVNAPTDAARASGMADSLKIDDARTRSILQSHLHIPDDDLERHLINELPFNADKALTVGLITGIREFQMPAGSQISNI